MKIINIMGSNGIGKSTRVNVLLEYMKTKHTVNDFEYNIIDKTGKNVRKTVGQLFSNGTLIVGKKNKANNWVSWDTADFSSWDKRISFFKDLNDNYPNVKIVIAEGYFNNKTMRASPNALRKATGCDSCSIYVFLYDEIDEFIERCNNRTGKNRGLDWAENSAGWRDNCGTRKLIDKYKLDNDKNDIINLLGKDEPRDYFVTEFFNDNFEVIEKEEVKEIDNSLDEW